MELIEDIQEVGEVF
jgi:hypothetical protein